MAFQVPITELSLQGKLPSRNLEIQENPDSPNTDVLLRTEATGAINWSKQLLVNFLDYY